MPGFNVNNFRSNGLVFAGARACNFTVTLVFPSVVDNPALAGQKAQLLVKSASLPDSVIGQVPVPFFGRTIKVAGNRTFDDWDITVMNDEDFLLRNAFEAWHNGINTIISNRLDSDIAGISPSLGTSYKTTAIVTQFAKTGPGDIDGDGAIKSYTFSGIFPVSVSPIPLAYDDINTFETFNVRFAYDWYEPTKSAADAPIFPLELGDDA